ncbi:hypothetical protein [Paenibacillus hamazuiensis]|uniref:hypothetical protein n=1 Tax=Paenibacillus hamazuiensis TaxID=2936508 RepID=UPI00200D9091|nr:hypothetical protein [Paenibacillus hamazuiensis]
MRIHPLGLQIGIVCFVLVAGISMKTIIPDSKAAGDQIRTQAPGYPKNENGQKDGSGLYPASANTSTKDPHYPKNENGQTYGFAADDTPAEMLPDLILAGSVDGANAYVLKKDFLDGQPTAPEEPRKSGSLGGRTVPLYDVDGKNIIGSFYIKPAKAPDYPKNEKGQTYGSSADATSPETMPDLISASGVDGTLGYLLKKDVIGSENPKTPEEALALQKSRPPGGRDIPLYDVDGETIIGVFHVN